MKDPMNFNKIKSPIDSRKRYTGDAMKVIPDPPKRGQIHVWGSDPCPFYRTGECQQVLAREVMYPSFDAPYELLQLEIYTCKKCNRQLARESWCFRADFKKGARLSRSSKKLTDSDKDDLIDTLEDVSVFAVCQANTEAGYPCKSDYRDRFHLTNPEIRQAIIQEDWEVLHRAEIGK